MKSSTFIAIRNQADTGTLELFFLDVITDTFDWFTGMSFSVVKDVIDKVNAAKPRIIKLMIDSPGGDAQAGLSIYNFLKRVDARVETEVIGLAGSIASVIAMAANPGKLRIARNGFMMIHRAEGIVAGTSDEIRAGADVVDAYTAQVVDIYSQRTSKTVDEVNALIASGDYWMSGSQAVEQGFADATFNDAAPAPVLNIAARLDLNHYKNLPLEIRAQLSAPPEAVPNQNFFTQQFTEMKNLFTTVLNAIRGVKPEEGKLITNQIADAMQAPFEALSGEIDNQINTAVTSEAVINTVVEKVKAQLPAPLAAPAPVDINAQVTAMMTAEGDNAVKTFVANAIAAAIKPLNDRNTELTNQLTTLLGKQGKSTETGEAGGGFVPRGSFKKNGTAV